MMNNQDRQEQTQKRPYRKPGVVQVSLRPDEAVLGACKNVGHSGPNAGSNCTPVSACYTRLS